MNLRATQHETTAMLRARRAQEAAQALRDSEANKLAIREKTSQLRALRLAREALEPPTKKKKR